MPKLGFRHSEDSKARQSATRKERIAAGLITFNHVAANLPVPPSLPLGSTRLVNQGYVQVKVSMTGRKWRRRSHLVMEAHLVRALLPGEVVHHRNHDRTDDRIENLLLSSQADHARIHFPKGPQPRGPGRQRAT